MKIFRREREGQITVELMLILPVLMLMVFFILEYGNIAYHTIIANHASYEFARIGALVAATKPSGNSNSSRAKNKINAAKTKVFGADAGRITVGVKIESTGRDPMYSRHHHDDVVVTVIYPVRLVFPGTSWLLASDPKSEGMRKIKAVTRMPVEKIYASSDPK
ncbi:MAG: pilus assembly protein [Elusimicrobiaceae bacterium]|nr:pilus assembly protein [Elusimicrobiaceae bacterium]